jgi:hypothetical protein
MNAEAEHIFLSLGEELSMIKAKIDVIHEAINRSYPKNHPLSKKMWDLNHHIKNKLCCELDSDICNYYPMEIKDLNGKSLTSVFYTTSQIENQFRDKPYQHRKTYSKQLSADENKYMLDLMRAIEHTLFNIVSDKDLFTKCTDAMVQKIIAVINDIETLIGPEN